MKKYETVSFTFNGKRYFCRGKTIKEASLKAAQKKKDLEAGRVAASNKTVNKWFQEYMDLYKQDIGEQTRINYFSLYKNSIAPYIGAMPIKNVTPAHIQKVMNNLRNVSLSHGKKVSGLLKSMFARAEENSLIPRSPVRNIIMPKLEDGERRALTLEERELFLAAAPTLGKEGLFFLVMYHLGLRPSEVARIKGEDIDRTKRILHVRGTKTKSATRNIPIPSALHLPECEGSMFLTTHGHEPYETGRKKWWKKVTKKMEEISGHPVAEDLTPYCLRHDYCTRLQEAGVPIDIARRLMGHSSVEITSRIYTHESDAALEQAREAIEKCHANCHAS